MNVFNCPFQRVVSFDQVAVGTTFPFSVLIHDHETLLSLTLDLMSLSRTIGDETTCILVSFDVCEIDKSGGIVLYIFDLDPIQVITLLRGLPRINDQIIDMQWFYQLRLYSHVLDIGNILFELSSASGSFLHNFILIILIIFIRLLFFKVNLFRIVNVVVVIQVMSLMYRIQLDHVLKLLVGDQVCLGYYRHLVAVISVF